RNQPRRLLEGAVRRERHPVGFEIVGAGRGGKTGFGKGHGDSGQRGTAWVDGLSRASVGAIERKAAHLGLPAGKADGFRCARPTLPTTAIPKLEITRSWTAFSRPRSRHLPEFRHHMCSEIAYYPDNLFLVVNLILSRDDDPTASRASD